MMAVSRTAMSELGERAYHLTAKALKRRTPPALGSTEKVAAIVMKLLEADISDEDVDWVLVNANVLTEAGIEYALNRRPRASKLQMVSPPPPFQPSDTERLRVHEEIERARQILHGPKTSQA